MVMFNCNRCSAGLRKKDVINHSFKCGGKANINLSCADCLKDFKGNEYDKHTSCVSEEVRYGGKGVVAKEAGKKQNQWLSIVRQVLEKRLSDDPQVIKFLKSIQNHENIPRNKRKFQNWAFSAMHIKDEQFLNTVFDLLQGEFTRLNEAKQIVTKNGETNGDSATLNETTEEPVEAVNGANGAVEGGEVVKKKKKKSNTNDVDAVEANGADENGEVVKKKKKKKSVVSEERVEEENGELNEDPMEEPEVEHPAEPAEPAETADDDSKLSKKEKKLKKKKAKFAAELMEIENFKKDEDEEEEVVEEERKPKKSKKRKLAPETTEEAKPETETKKSKVDDSLIENENHKIDPDAETETPSKKEKFKWHDNILNVLKKSKDSEVSVKQMAKKIIGEYVAQYGDKAIHEKLNSKLNKKLKTCPGVKVLKDKVQLVESED